MGDLIRSSAQAGSVRVRDEVLKRIKTLRLNDQQREELEYFLEDQRGGPIITSIMKCRHQQCPVRNRCPLFKQGITASLAENNEDCPIELSQVIMWTQELVDELGGDAANASTIALIKSYVMHNLVQWRLQTRMSDEDIIQNTVRAVTPQGQVIEEQIVNPVIKSLLDISKRNQNILKELLATPNSKDRAKGGKQDGFTLQYKSVLGKLKKHRDSSFEEPDRKKLGITKDQIDASDELGLDDDERQRDDDLPDIL